MIKEKDFPVSPIHKQKQLLIGTLGYLVVFVWSMGVVIFSPEERLVLSASLCLLVAALLRLDSFRRLIHWRWLFIFSTLVLVNSLWVGQVDQEILGIPFSLTGLLTGLRMVLRAIVILVAVDGFASSVDISEVAGLLERLGLPGLGFALGVAMNLLPNLRQSSANVWRSLWMRGGLRRKRLRSVQFLLVTVIANALRRGEEIALAAEARAYTPDRTRSLPLKKGRLDRVITLLALASGLLFLIIR